MFKKDLKLGDKLILTDGIEVEVGHSALQETKKVLIGRNPDNQLFAIGFDRYSDRMRHLSEPNSSVANTVEVIISCRDDFILAKYLNRLASKEINTIEFYTNCKNYDDIKNSCGVQKAIEPTNAYQISLINVADGQYACVACYGGGDAVMYNASESIRTISCDILNNLYNTAILIQAT